MDIFYQEKPFYTRKKFKKNDFALSEKFSCYAPGHMYICKYMCEKFCSTWAKIVAQIASEVPKIQAHRRV